MNKQTIINMESMQCRSYQEERDYSRELAEIESIIKSVQADKIQVKAINSKLDPSQNYKLTYR